MKIIISVAGIIIIALLALFVYAESVVHPEIEVQVTDTKQVFIIQVHDNKVFVAEGNAQNPDLIIVLSTAEFVALFEADDLEQEINNQVNKGNIEAEILTDYTSLLLKGYIALYDTVRDSN